MAVRWRKDGSIVCAAISKARKTDVYISDPLHYKLSVELGVLVEKRKDGTTWRWRKPSKRFVEERFKSRRTKR